MRIAEYTFKSEKLKGPHRLVLLSDFHNMKRSLEKAVIKTSYVNPELILVAGDLVDRHRRRDNLALEFLRRCVMAAPVFFSYGNHECRFDRIGREEFESTGAVVLKNEYRKFTFLNGDEIFIGGHEPKSPTVWLDNFERERGFKLLLCHHPEDFIRGIAARDIDLSLAGHTHGGQIRLFGRGLLAPGQGLLPKYTRGFFFNKLIVGAGISNTAGIVPRINNETEVVLIRLEPVAELKIKPAAKKQAEPSKKSTATKKQAGAVKKPAAKKPAANTKKPAAKKQAGNMKKPAAKKPAASPKKSGAAQKKTGAAKKQSGDK